MPPSTKDPAPLSPSKPSTPNLGDVITTDDVSQKGTGSYKADYVNWCRVAHLLHEHAPGWQFHLHLDVTLGGHVWKAPNDTAYVVGYFTGPNGERTPDFPQAVMDNRNNPVPYAKVTARDLTDTHRRALAACSAFTFGLGWQLWAREEIENPMRDSAPAAPVEKPHDVDDGDVPLAENDKELLLDLLDELSDAKLEQFCKAFDGTFVGQGPVSDRIQTVNHQKFINDWHSKQRLSKKDLNE